MSTAIIIFLYVMSFIEGGTPLSGGGSLVSHLLKELLSGPLLGRRVTLLLEEETPSRSFHPDGLIGALDHPVYLLRLPREGPEIELNVNSDAAIPDNSSTKYYPMVHSVLIVVLQFNSSFWWPLWFPPNYWKLEAIILIASLLPCLAENYLETPLLARPSSLAVICPYNPRNPQNVTTDFKVWTRKPYSRESPQTVDLGMWNSGESFQEWNQLFVDRFHDMGRKNMSILASGEDRPLLYVSPEGVVKGLNYNIMDALRRWLHFGLTYKTDPTLLWTTILDSINREENDVFINYATITAERSDEFDFTVPYLKEGFAMMLEVPPPLPRWQSILFPFTKWVWTAVLISTLCSTVTYHLLTCKRHLSLTRNSLTIFQSLLSYPLDHVPALWRLRNFLLFWWVVTWFVNTIYRSNLIAVLTVPVFPTKIQTAEGLANSKYRLCMLDYGEFVDEALAESTHPVLSRLSKVLDMVPIIDDIQYTGEEQCIELVLAGTHAHIETYSYVKILYSMLGHGAQVYSLREQLYPGHLAFMVKKNTPWKYKFDTGMQWMFETGLIQKWHKDAMDEFRGYLETKPAPELVPLSLAHLQGPFLIYILSILLAILVLLWEILYHPRKKKTLSKKREISKY